MVFEENIKKWLILDNKIKELNNQLKSIRSEKNQYNNNIIEYISNNNLDNATIKIHDSKLKFMNTNYSQPLSYKFIYDALNKYYHNEDKTIEIINFIKSQREVKIIKEIKRFTITD